MSDSKNKRKWPQLYFKACRAVEIHQVFLAGGLSTIVELVIHYILQAWVFQPLNDGPFQFWIFP